MIFTFERLSALAKSTAYSAIPPFKAACYAYQSPIFFVNAQFEIYFY